jgi:hypothetical protein
MARREILVFDIGGTNVRGAIYDPVSGALLPEFAVGGERAGIWLC